MESLFSMFDVRLVPWVAVICALTFWLKKKGTPSWLPLPLLVFVISYVISTAFGYFVDDNPNGFSHMIISILYYGLGNGLLITMIAVFGYDIVHAVTKYRSARKEESETETVTATATAATKTTKATAAATATTATVTKTELTDEEKKVIKTKALIYSISAVVGLAALAFFAYFALDSDLTYAFFYGIFGAGLFFVLARTIYHIATGDTSGDMFMVSIYGLFACIFWLFGILSTTWGGASFAMAICILCIILAIGFRFIRKKEEK